MSAVPRDLWLTALATVPLALQLDAQELAPAIPEPDDLPAVRALLAESAADLPGALVVVVVREGRPPFLAFEGELSDGIAPSADTPLPLAAGSRWLGGTLVAALGEAEGWDLREPIAESVPDSLPDELRNGTWLRYCGGLVDGTSLTWRTLRPGEGRRTAAEIIAAHGFDDPYWAPRRFPNPAGPHDDWYRDDLPWAVLETAAAQRIGQPTEVWLRRAAAGMQVEGIDIDRPGSAPPIVLWSNDDSWETAGSVAPREVVLGGGLGATPAAIADVLEWILAAPEARGIALTPVHHEAQRLSYRRSSAHTLSFTPEQEAVVHAEGGAAWFAWTSRGRDCARWRALHDALHNDLLGAVVNDLDDVWRSGGLPLATVPHHNAAGRFRASFTHLGERLELDVDLRRGPGPLRLGDRTGVAIGTDSGFVGELTLADGTHLELRAQVGWFSTSAVATIVDDDRSQWPYPVEVRRSREEPRGSPPDDLAWAGRPLDAATAELHQALRAGDAGAARLLLVVRSDGTKWIGTSGFAERDAPVEDSLRLPLGTLSRAVLPSALEVLVASGRIEAGATVRALRGDAPLPYPEWIAERVAIDLARRPVDLGTSFRWLSEFDQARPLDEILRRHAFRSGRASAWMARRDSNLPRAILQEALATRGIVPDWRRFVAEELAPALDMPSLRDVSDAAADREELGGVVIPVAEVASDGNLWATSTDLATWTSRRLREKRAERPWCAFEIATSAGPARAIALVHEGPGPRVAQLLLPNLDLGFLAWIASEDDTRIAAMLLDALAAFWPVADLADLADLVHVAPPSWVGWVPEGAAHDGPRGWVGTAGELGTLEIRLAREPGGVEVRVGDDRVECLASLRGKGVVRLLCAAPPGQPAEARLSFLIEQTDGTWTGHAEFVHVPTRWSAYELRLEPLED